MLIASYLFLSWLYLSLPLLVGSLTLVTYVFGLLMKRLPRVKLPLLLGSLVLVLGSLIAFKYSQWLLGISGSTLVNPLLRFGLPVGISFYTFQLVGYLLDVFRDRIPAEKHLGMFALFTLFFPKFVAGPIEKPQELIPQFSSVSSLSYGVFATGLRLFGLGLFKKLVVADNLLPYINKVFDALPEYKGLSLVLIMLMYAWYIYADFSGYTDLARGSALMLGIKLSPNFNHPYLAVSIRDFWRRWHISLSTWLKDYVYIPLGGSRVSLMRLVVNTLIVFIICGIWHGAAITFVIWGIWHGVWVAAEHIFQKVSPLKIRIPRIMSGAYAFGLVVVGWVFFRAPTVEDAWYILRNAVVGVTHFLSPNYILATVDQIAKANYLELAIAVFGLSALLAYEFVWSHSKIRHFFFGMPTLLRYGVYVLIGLSILLIRNPTVKTFVYAQF